MNDYSDLIFLMGAMILFSLLTLNVSRNVVMNNETMVESEVEYEAIALAQGIVDQALWTNTEEELDKESGDYIFTEPALNDIGDEYEYDYDISVEIENVTDTTPGDENVINKEVTVTVTSEYLNNPVTLKFIKSFQN